MDISLDDLFDGSERDVREWLHDRDLLHQCDCGYTVYSVDAVNEAFQEEYGDKRCDDIFHWACNLSNQFGWMWEQGSNAEFGIYHCQYCSESEFSLLLDLQRIASGTKTLDKGSSRNRRGDQKSKQQKYKVYIDESYSQEFPRKPGGSYSYAAVIVPESEVPDLTRVMTETISASYRASPPKELKYQKYSKHPRLLEKIGNRLSEFLTQTPGIAVIGLYVPRDGYFSEKARTYKAFDFYNGKAPDFDDIAKIDSQERIEKAVREAWRDFAFTLAACVGQYISGLNGHAKLYFDPIGAKHDRPLFAMIREILPKLPIDEPRIRHGNKILTVGPSEKSKRLKKRIRLGRPRRSEKSPGLQIADFLAGDLRAFFDENQEFLYAALTQGLLINKNVLFPQTDFIKTVSPELMEKVTSKTGKSFLPQYRSALAHGLISYYTSNGHMRAFDTANAEFRDMVD